MENNFDHLPVWVHNFSHFHKKVRSCNFANEKCYANEHNIEVVTPFWLESCAEIISNKKHLWYTGGVGEGKRKY